MLIPVYLSQNNLWVGNTVCIYEHEHELSKFTKKAVKLIADLNYSI